MKRWLMATLAALILMAGLASLPGCAKKPVTAGPRDSEEATIRVRNGSSLVLELQDNATAKWEHDSNAKEWAQNKTRSRSHLVIQVTHTGTCKAVPTNPTSVHVVHVQGVMFELRLRNRKTRIRDHGRLALDSNMLVYRPTSGDDYISEIWIDGARICTFKSKDELTHMDLKRQ